MRTPYNADVPPRRHGRPSQNRMALAIALLIGGVALSGCASKRDRYDVPEIPVPKAFQKVDRATGSTEPPKELSANSGTESSTGAAGPVSSTLQTAINGLAVQPMQITLGTALPEWWRLLNNNELDELINRVIANNADLRIATLRVIQAKARAAQADADRYPVITAPFRHGYESPVGGLGSVPENGDRRKRHTYQASIRGDWRADLWGERQALYESADLQVWRAIFQLDETRRQVVANTVNSYIEYLSLNDRIRVARETEKTLAGMVESVGDRMKIGDATAIDYEQQRAAVFAVRATIPALEQRREEMIGVLALLAGSYTGTLDLGDGGLTSISYPTVMPGVPSSLLLRRPDVRVIEARMLAADADIDVARARILPPLDLTAQIGYGSLHLAELFKPHSYMYSAAASLVATIFDKGKRDREVEFAAAVHEELVETYVRVVYNAVREVEDALYAVRATGRRMGAQQESVDAAKRAYSFSTESYAAGAIDYLTLLDTERTYHRNLDELHNLRMDRYKSMVALFAALGGGNPVGAPIPGEGLRPVPPIAENALVATVVTTPGASGDVGGGTPSPARGVYEGFEVATEGEQERVRDAWLVELAGTFERAHIAPAWQDLRTRFPELMAQRSLLPRKDGAIEYEEADRTSWHRLFVAGFTIRSEADQLCNALRNSGTRCRIVSAAVLGPGDPVPMAPASTSPSGGGNDNVYRLTPNAKSDGVPPAERMRIGAVTETKIASR